MTFDDIRPYSDAEIPAAVGRIAELDVLPQIMKYIYPGTSPAEAIGRLCKVHTVRELQAEFMNPAIQRIAAATTEGFTFSGLNRLRRDGNYLFVSNHRDITLDAFFLQHLLFEHKGDTSYIVFGENLLAMPAAADIFRCNKMIGMSRGGSPRTFYNSLRHLSEYIHQLVVEERHSVWIAQNNGRAKDGIDLTAPAMVKMLTLGSDAAPQQALADLHIVPVSISYEWDPCDVLKANELAASKSGHYVKAPGEDFNSVVTGIVGRKGMVHLAVGQPLTPDELVPLDREHVDVHVANVIDRRIVHNYRLMPSNFAAYDQLNGTSRYRHRYSASTQRELQRRLDLLPDAEQRGLLLAMYANPVSSSLMLTRRNETQN